MLERLRLETLTACRAFRRTPATIVVAVVTLALAVGLNLAMFGLIDRALLSPPAHVVDPDRVFTVGFEAPGTNGTPGWMTTTSYVTFDTIRQHVAAAIDVAAWQRSAITAVVDGVQVRADAMLVSGSYFTLLGARPLAGRVLLPSDDRSPAGSPVVVVSQPFWKDTFGGDRTILGRRLAIRGTEYTVVGVVPDGFSGHSAARVDLWMPFHAAMQESPGWDQNAFRNFASIIVRVKDAASLAAATTQATAAIERRVLLTRISGDTVTSVERRIAYWLTGIAALLLVIGLANSATLLLVRGAGRRQEFAIRAALGASRGRLRSQIVVESAVLAVASVSIALILASWFDEAVRRVLLPSLVESEGLNRRIAGAAAASGLLMLVVTAAAGFAHTPSLTEAHSDRPRSRAHTPLLVVQTMLSMVLIAGAGLFSRSLHNLVAQDFGMRMHDVLLVQFEQGADSPPDRAELFREALDRIRGLPGVQAATVIQQIPFTGFHVPPISVPGFPDAPNVDGQLPYLIAATPELLDILDVRMIEGRRFTAADEHGAPVVIVNDAMARTLWPGQTALGKCIRIGFEPSFDPFTADGPPPPPTTVPCREVIGVARGVRQRSLLPTGNEDRLMQYFVPFSQVPPPPGAVGEGPGVAGLMLRAKVAPETLAGPIRRFVVAGRTDLPFLQVRRYADLLERQMRPWRLGTALLGLFSVLALVVAAVGLYAAFAHSVVERRRELAIRMAIGAHASGVLRMILREAARVATAGVLCGAVLAVLIARYVQSMLFGTAPADPWVLGAAAVVMLGIAALATFIPARAASRVDPAALLKIE